MRKVLQIILIFSFTIIFSQKQIISYYDYKKLEPNEVYSVIKVNGVNTLHGIYKKYDKQGYINVECNYNYGKINGDYKIYLSADDAFILSNNPKEYIKQYAGKISRIIQYSNGNLNGTDIQYEYINPNNKFIRTKTVYLKGIPIEEESYFSEKKPQKICQNGIYKEYDYDTGNLIYEYQYNKNLKIRDGLSKTYYSNGIIKYSAIYKNDLKDGIFKTYDKNGNLYSEEKYQNDYSIGTPKFYTESGIEKDNSKYNLILGQEKEFFENNEKFSLKFLGNKKYLKTIFYSNGNKKTESELKQFNTNDFLKDGIEKSYYEDGKLLNSITFTTFRYNNQVYERKQGLSKFYYNSGSLEVEGVFKNDVMVGKWNDYYENGQIRKELIFRNYENPLDNIDEKYCHYREFYPNGNLKTMGVYSDFRNNVRLDEFEYFDINGNMETDESQFGGTYIINDIYFEDNEINMKIDQIEFEYDEDNNEKVVNKEEPVKTYKIDRNFLYKDCSNMGKIEEIDYNNILDRKNILISEIYGIGIKNNVVIEITSLNCFN